jgi:hypothetical protein
VIESPFATVRLRQRVTKGAGSRTKGLLIAYKLLDMAQARWRRLDGSHLLPLVQAGIRFIDGVQQPSTKAKPRAEQLLEPLRIIDIGLAPRNVDQQHLYQFLIALALALALAKFHQFARAV